MKKNIQLRFFLLLLLLQVNILCEAQNTNLTNNATYGQRYQEQIENNTAKPNAPLYNGGNSNSSGGSSTEMFEKGYWNKINDRQVKQRIADYENYKRQKAIDDKAADEKAYRQNVQLQQRIKQRNDFYEEAYKNYLSTGLFYYEAREMAAIEYFLKINQLEYPSNSYKEKISLLSKLNKEVNTASYDDLFNWVWQVGRYAYTTSIAIQKMQQRFPAKKVELEKAELILMSYYFGGERPNIMLNDDANYPNTIYEYANYDDKLKVIKRFLYLSNLYADDALSMAGHCRPHLNPYLLLTSSYFSEIKPDNVELLKYHQKVLFSQHQAQKPGINNYEIWVKIINARIRNSIEWITNSFPDYFDNFSPTQWAALRRAQGLEYYYILRAFRIDEKNNKYSALKDAMKGKGFDKGPETGFGTAFINIGGYYEGNFENGKPNGIGKYENEDGTVYEGNFKNGDFEGKGKITWSDGETYVGDFKNNMAEGIGIKTYSYRGQIYEGGFKENKRSGQGVIKWTLGASYSSMFKNDVENGEGIMKNVNGSYEKCIYKNGRILSIKYFSKNNEELSYDEYNKIEKIYNGTKYYGADLYTGQLVKDEANGKGILKEANGNTYNGDWINGKKEGIGIYTWGNGDIYEGEYKNNIVEGKGVIKYKDSSALAVYFKNGKAEGLGVKKYKNGTVFTCEYKEGKLQGNAKFVWPNGDYLTNKYENNKKVGEWIFTKPNGNYSKGLYVNNEIANKKYFDKDDKEITKEEFGK